MAGINKYTLSRVIGIDIRGLAGSWLTYATIYIVLPERVGIGAKRRKCGADFTTEKGICCTMVWVHVQPNCTSPCGLCILSWGGFSDE